MSEYGYPISDVQNLEHNASVCFFATKYITEDGREFWNDEISISDGMHHLSLIAKEAINLLKWLEQEKPTLEKMAKEQEA